MPNTNAQTTAAGNKVIVTSQMNGKQYNADLISKHALFLGGLNTTNAALKQYDPLVGGYVRIFFTRMPRFLEVVSAQRTKNIKHILEYGFTKIGGISGLSLDTDQITGGYAGNSFEVPTMSKDDTNSLSMTVFEFSGSPVREYFDLWITGIRDPHTGVATYHGAFDPVFMGNEPLIQYGQHNHTAEAFIVATDPTGLPGNIEYACLMTNLVPKGISKDHFNFDAGSHNIVQVDIDFTANKIESAQVTQIASALLKRFPIQTNYLGFQTEYKVEDIKGMEKKNFVNWRLGTPLGDGTTSTGAKGIGAYED